MFFYGWIALWLAMRIRDPITDYLFEKVLPKLQKRPCYRCRHFEASRIIVENITFEMDKCRRKWRHTNNTTLPLYVSFLRKNESFCGNSGKYYTPEIPPIANATDVSPVTDETNDSRFL